MVGCICRQEGMSALNSNLALVLQARRSHWSNIVTLFPNHCYLGSIFLPCPASLSVEVDWNRSATQ